MDRLPSRRCRVTHRSGHRADYRDLTIEQLADDLALMTERAVTTEASRDTYRSMMQELLRILHVAMRDPEGCTRVARRMNDGQTRATTAAIGEMFAGAHHTH